MAGILLFIRAAFVGFIDEDAATSSSPGFVDEDGATSASPGFIDADGTIG